MSEGALFRLHAGLPRQGPGCTACTREVLARLRPHLPARPAVADFGCGSGAAALVLAEELRVPVLALDLHAGFIRELEVEAARRGLAALIEARIGDMAEPPVGAGSLDLIWSEGAIYLLGFEAGLRRWRPLLRPGGCIAASELSWLGAARPDDAALFWREAYPGMGSVAQNVARAEAAGFRVLDTVSLPPSAWFDPYYRPLLARCDALEADADRELAQAIVETRHEIALFERFCDAYGYVFYLLTT